jgi:hypothetical protein
VDFDVKLLTVHNISRYVARNFTGILISKQRKALQPIDIRVPVFALDASSLSHILVPAAGGKITSFVVNVATRIRVPDSATGEGNPMAAPASGVWGFRLS